MALFISFQILFNLATVAAVVWFVLRRGEHQMGSALSHPHTDWKKEWELEKESFQQQIAVQLRSIKLLQEQTKKLIDEKQNAWPSLPPSVEESEIKALLNEKSASVIPTLAEFEAQKEKLIHENPFDLKSVLTHQLS